MWWDERDWEDGEEYFGTSHSATNTSFRHSEAQTATLSGFAVVIQGSGATNAKKTLPKKKRTQIGHFFWTKSTGIVRHKMAQSAYYAVPLGCY